MVEERQRIVFLDYLRAGACLLVMLAHACEAFYLNANGFHIATPTDAWAVTLIDSACRAAVPLFVMASAYLLFPLKVETGPFFKRRLTRVLIPFLIWEIGYNIHDGGSWGPLFFNFQMSTGGHLWFVPMLLGLYLLMPLLSPWAEKASAREVRGWLILWGVTTLFPYARRLLFALYGEPSFGAIPYLWGECPWNAFGTFHYVSGFIGYLLLGFYLRKFTGDAATPSCHAGRGALLPATLWVVGWLIAAAGFYCRIPLAGGYPVTQSYATAVDLEMSWEFCSFGIALTVVGYFLLCRRFCTGGGRFYACIISPISRASYGMYLMHMLILTPVVTLLREVLPSPATIPLTALVTYLLCAIVAVALQKIPKLGKYICG